MNTTTPPPVSAKGTSGFVRPLFKPGLLLEDEDLTAIVDYSSAMTRLLFSSLFGCGVICGLKITAMPVCKGQQLEIMVGKGLALDCSGNPIYVPTDQSAIIFDPGCEGFPATLWVTACYVADYCRPRSAACADDDDPQTVKTRMRDGFEIQIHQSLPEHACMCPANGHDDCGCVCNCGECVLIGVIELKSKYWADPDGKHLNPDAKIDVQVDRVRKIRPALRQPCGAAKLADAATGNDPHKREADEVGPSTLTPEHIAGLKARRAALLERQRVAKGEAAEQIGRELDEISRLLGG
ncbi:MAG: hypothetical protein EOP19_00860 [Hyphomicrobiales bacterium]|nr:MAG: hypothetical protein EOP19_00860 [Hyphomicrobiales bacterium]